VNKNQLILVGFLLCFIALSCGKSTSRKQSLNTKNNEVLGKVVKILDGDTYDLLLDNKTTIRIRIEGIDAPEKGMPFGKKAKQYLGDLCQGQTIKIQKTNKDQYGRILGFSYLADGRELGKEMLKAGYAWHYKHYNSDPELAALEETARNAKIGLWVEQPYVIPPWIVRKLNKQGYKIQEIYEAQREHLKGLHAAGCPDKTLCEKIKEEK